MIPELDGVRVIGKGRFMDVLAAARPGDVLHARIVRNGTFRANFLHKRHCA